MQIPRDILEILTTKVKDFKDGESIMSWVNMLNYSDEQFDSLSSRERRIFLDKSEEFRKFWNIERMVDVVIYKNGQPQTGQNNIPSLDIKKEDIPNKIYNLDNSDKPDNFLDKPLDKLTKLYYNLKLRLT